MFSLHETTRRRFCQWGFVALCVLPTGLVLGGAYWLRSDNYRRRQEASLSQQFGLPVSIAKVTHPTPTTTRYERLEMLDPETKGLLARADVAIVDEQAGSLRLTLTQAEISSAFLERLRQWTDDRLRGKSIGTARKLELEPCGLVINYFTPDRSPKRLVELTGQIDLAAKEPIAMISCHLEGSGNAEPCTLRMWRDRGVTPARSNFEISTGGPLPCLLAAPLLPALSRLGNRAEFEGTLWASAAPGGWEGAIEGPAKIMGVDLDALVSGQLPHHLDGTAQIGLSKLSFRRGRVEEVKGSLSAGPGIISYTLLDGAVAEGLAVGLTKAKKPGHSLAYEELAMSFVLDSRGITLAGQCHGAAAGTLLTMRYPDREQAVPVAASPGERQSVAALVRALAGKGESLLPASAEAQSLARLLPLEPAARKTQR